jgi:hypothetical protein
MRLRRATTLPSEFQNLSSSGFQSAIQREVSLLIEFPFRLWREARVPAVSLGEKQKPPPRGACAFPPRAAALPMWPFVGPAVRHALLRVANDVSSFVPDHGFFVFVMQIKPLGEKRRFLTKPYRPIFCPT